jgi:chaperone BCS1
MTLLEVAVAGGLMAAIIAAFVASFKRFLSSVPKRVWDFIVRRCSLSITFLNGEPSFGMIQKWLAEHPYSKRTRAIKLQWNPSEGKFTPVPGYGLHWLWWKNGPLWIRYGVKDTKGDWGGTVKEESYTVTIVALGHEKMLAFLDDIKRFQKREESHLVVYTWSGYWNWTGPRRKRELRTVYMPETAIANILKIIDDFIASEEWYVTRGIPYRLGLCIYGPPGTGKTTLATAIAGHYNRPIYCANLNSIGSDESVLKAFTTADKDGIILIEDIDTFDMTARRDDVEDEKSVTAPETVNEETGEITPGASSTNNESPGTVAGKLVEKKKTNSLTLSGLLNAIDGVAATEGRILIMTTNDLDRLDPALVRSGRINKRVEVSYLTPDDVVRMFTVFYPEAKERAPEIRRFAGSRSVTAAAWQKLFINYHDDVNKLFAEVVNNPHSHSL